MIDPQHVRQLIAWCEARSDDSTLREIAATLRSMQDQYLDILAVLRLPDHGPVHIVEEIQTILNNQDEAEHRAEAAELLLGAHDTRTGNGPPNRDSDRIRAWRLILAAAQQICEANGGAFRFKTVYEDLIVSAGDGASAELQRIMDQIETVANAVDPESGVLRATDDAE